jgi:hypothetical protein
MCLIGIATPSLILTLTELEHSLLRRAYEDECEGPAPSIVERLDDGRIRKSARMID